MRLRGRELYIIVAVVGVAVCLMWWFFLYSPKQKELGNLNSQYTQLSQQYDSVRLTLQRFEEYKKTAPQAEADTIKINKAIPNEDAIPSFMIAIKDTVDASGLKLIVLTPGVATHVATMPFAVQAFSLQLSGRYFDVEDFLYRLENYVDYRNQSFLVTGRMFAVTAITLGAGKLGFPDLAVTISLNGYQWNSQVPLAPVAPTTNTGAK